MVYIFQADTTMEVNLQSPNSHKKRDSSPSLYDMPIKQSKSLEEAQLGTVSVSVWFIAFLAHLARRAIAITMRPSSSVNFFKRLLLWNYWADWNQTWYDCSL